MSKINISKYMEFPNQLTGLETFCIYLKAVLHENITVSEIRFIFLLALKDFFSAHISPGYLNVVASNLYFGLLPPYEIDSEDHDLGQALSICTDIGYNYKNKERRPQEWNDCQTIFKKYFEDNKHYLDE